MNIAVTGGTGFVGQALIEALTEAGHSGWIISRSAENKASGTGLGPAGSFVQISWEQLEQDPLLLKGVDAVVNLAGESISQRWTNAAKQRIRSSRINAASALSAALNRAGLTPDVLVQASGVNAYGFSDSATFTEDSPVSEGDFLASVVRDWEHAARAIPAKRIAMLRFGIVLGASGGALPSMLLPFRMMAGGPLGSGDQWISWIHKQDLIRLIIYTLEHSSLEGAVNAVSPEPVRNSEFGRAAAAALGRPYWLVAPATPLRLLLGEMSELLLKGQKVLPVKAIESGFQFRHHAIREALNDLVGKHSS